MAPSEDMTGSKGTVTGIAKKSVQTGKDAAQLGVSVTNTFTDPNFYRQAITKGAFWSLNKIIAVILLIIIFLTIVAAGLVLTAWYKAGVLGEKAAKARLAFSEAGIVQLVSGSYKRLFMEATGEYYHGDVEQTKEFVGIKLLDPFVQNKLDYDLDEKDYAEVGARLIAFNSRKEITKISLTCNAENDPWKMVPEKVENTRYALQDLTCLGPGNNPKFKLNTLTITATAENFRTDTRLVNNFIEAGVLDQKVEAYAKSTNTYIRDHGDYVAALQKIFPQVNDRYYSVSDSGPIKLILVTDDAPVVGIGLGKNIKVTIAIENMAEGKVVNIKSLKITLPEGLTVKDNAGSQTCKAFKTFKQENEKNERVERVIAMKDDVAKRLNVSAVNQGFQMAIASCILEVKDINSLKKLLDFPASPNPREFNAELTYDYSVDKKYVIKLGSLFSETAESGYFDQQEADGSQYQGISKDSSFTFSGSGSSGKCGDVIAYSFKYLGAPYGSPNRCSPAEATAGTCTMQCGSFVSSIYAYTGHAPPLGNGGVKCENPLMTKIGSNPDALQPGDVFSYKNTGYGHTGMYVGKGFYHIDASGNYVFNENPEGKHVFVHQTTACNEISKRCREVQFVYYERLQRYNPVFCRHKDCI